MLVFSFLDISWRVKIVDKNANNDTYCGDVGCDQLGAKCFTGGDQAASPVARGRYEEDC
jgi:hypothetical protein